MSDTPRTSNDLVARLRAITANSNIANEAADCIEQLQMPPAKVRELAHSEEGADNLALIRALCKQVEGQRKHIATLEKKLATSAHEANMWRTRAQAREHYTAHEPPATPMSAAELHALCKRFVVEGYHGDYLENDGFELAREVEELTLKKCGAFVPPPDAPKHRMFDVLIICTAYESGYGHGNELDDLPNPYLEGSDEHHAYSIGYEEGESRRRRNGSSGYCNQGAHAICTNKECLCKCHSLTKEGSESNAARTVDERVSRERTHERGEPGPAGQRAATDSRPHETSALREPKCAKCEKAAIGFWNDVDLCEDHFGVRGPAR